MPGVGYQLKPPRAKQGDPHYQLNPTTLTVFHGVFHPSTSPEAIAKAQRADIKEAISLLGKDAIAAISEAVVLDTWTVTRRIAEIYGEPVPPPPKTRMKRAADNSKRPRVITEIMNYLRQFGKSAAPTIANGIRRRRSSVGVIINNHPQLFLMAGIEENAETGRSQRLFKLKENL